VTSEEHVDVKWADGTISSDKLRITGGGETVRFEGHVVMNIDKLPPPAAEAPAPDPAPAPVRPAKTRSLSNKSANSK
jgi:lipopolysaccharide export system protein LptC